MSSYIQHGSHSVCPVCLKRIPAERVEEGRDVFLRKSCPEHGDFRTILWRGRTDIREWTRGVKEAPFENPRCPEACGLCSDHLQDTCCTLLEVTKRCNLACRFCFAGGGEKKDPSFEQIRSWIVQLTKPGKTLLQLSGGEPTMRDDVAEIVIAAKEAGCRHVQLNTNGIRLAEDAEFVRDLAEAGLSFVFMQFDGTDDTVYGKLRGRPLVETKRRAIENCAERNVGVTLVPTLVPGVNTEQIGGILRFAVSMSPAVRGVHFQPVGFFGRTPAAPADEMRFTLDELLFEMNRQTNGAVTPENVNPSHCNHPLCGFHGDFMVAQGGELIPLTRRNPGEGCCGSVGSADQNRAFIAKRWERPKRSRAESCCDGPHDMDGFLDRVKSHGFTITAMAFQDAGNLDLERLRRCSLHVFDDGRFAPFCAYYLSAWRR